MLLHGPQIVEPVPHVLDRSRVTERGMTRNPFIGATGGSIQTYIHRRPKYYAVHGRPHSGELVQDEVPVPGPEDTFDDRRVPGVGDPDTGGQGGAYHRLVLMIRRGIPWGNVPTDNGRPHPVGLEADGRIRQRRHRSPDGGLSRPGWTGEQQHEGRVHGP